MSRHSQYWQYRVGRSRSRGYRVLAQVAMQIAYAIDHVQAYEQIDRLRDQLAKENVYLDEELTVMKNVGSLMGESLGFRHVIGLAHDVASMPSTVFITAQENNRLPSRSPHNAPNVRSKKLLVRVMCCWMSDCKSRAPARQSSLV